MPMMVFCYCKGEMVKNIIMQYTRKLIEKYGYESHYIDFLTDIIAVNSKQFKLNIDILAHCYKYGVMTASDQDFIERVFDGIPRGFNAILCIVSHEIAHLENDVPEHDTSFYEHWERIIKGELCLKSFWNAQKKKTD